MSAKDVWNTHVQNVHTKIADHRTGITFIKYYMEKALDNEHLW